MLVPLLLLIAAALAATPAELARIRYLSNDGRRDEALRLGAEVIAADPSDVSAHITWIEARSWRVPDPRVRAIYEGWAAEEPGNPVARVAPSPPTRSIAS